MSIVEGLIMYRLFWALVGFPVLIIGNLAMAYIAWKLLEVKGE